MAKYLITGIQSACVKGDHMPANIHPWGLVIKKSIEEPYRAILDLRLFNMAVSDWIARKMRPTSVSAFLFGSKAWCFSFDISAAFYTVQLGGLCRTGHILLNGDPQFMMGCTPSTCKGRACDKNLLGTKWHMLVSRFNTPPFSMKVSGNALAIFTDEFIRRWRKKGVRVCTLQEEIERDLKELGWMTNNKSSELPTMNGEFIGIFFDTWKGIFFVTAEKADSLVREASEILERNMTST
eukprot:2107857-Rhodomonas_salina.2